jgi:hypothetical protein
MRLLPLQSAGKQPLSKTYPLKFEKTTSQKFDDRVQQVSKKYNPLGTSMALLQLIKDTFSRPDPFDEVIKQLLKKKENIMLDKLAALFPEQPVQNVSQLLSSVGNFVQFVDQKVEGDAAKLNEAIDHIKAVFDSHKK